MSRLPLILLLTLNWFSFIPPHPQTFSYKIKKSPYKLFYNPNLSQPCSYFFFMNPILLSCQYRFRLNTSWMQLLVSSSSACPGAAVSINAPSLLLLLLFLPTWLQSPLSKVSTRQQYAVLPPLATVVLQVLEEPQLLVWQGLNTQIQVCTT